MVYQTPRSLVNPPHESRKLSPIIPKAVKQISYLNRNKSINKLFQSFVNKTMKVFLVDGERSFADFNADFMIRI